MFILDSLNIDKNNIYSVDTILDVIKDNINDSEKINDYFNRKFNQTNNFYIFKFKSINPVSFDYEVFKKDDLSDSFKTNDDFFYPLFLSYNITNNQYIKTLTLSGGKEVEVLNRGSFSDYFLCNKLFDKIKDKKDQLLIYKNDKTFKKNILSEYYKQVNNLLTNNKLVFEKSSTKNLGPDFFIDFSSVFDIKGLQKSEIDSFFNNLINEYKIDLNLKTNLEKDQINKYIYILENLEYQYFVKNKFKYNGEKISIVDCLKFKVDLPFEFPSNEKTTLKKDRTKKLKASNDLPKITFLESVILRILVININKQGSHSNSGYHFDIKNIDFENNQFEDLPNYIKSTMSYKLQITSDNYGNLSINNIDIKNIKEIDTFNNILIDNFNIFYNKQYNTNEAISEFIKKVRMLNEKFLSNEDKIKEKIYKNLDAYDYISLYKNIYNFIYLNFSKIILKYDDERKPINKFDLNDLDFVVNSLKKFYVIKNGGSFVDKNEIDLKELSTKENINSDEFYYILGSSCGISIRNSKNVFSLKKKFLQNNKLDSILNNLSECISNYEEEIESKSFLNLLNKQILKNKPMFYKNSSLNSEEKFSFITGLLNNSYKYDKKTEENQND